MDAAAGQRDEQADRCASSTIGNRTRSTDARTRVASKDPMITPAAAPGTMADAAASSTLWSPAYVSAATTEIGSTAAIVVPLAVARAIPILREVSTGTMTTPPAISSSPHSPPATAPAAPRTTMRLPGLRRLFLATPGESAGFISRLRTAAAPSAGCRLRRAWPVQVAVFLQRSPVLLQLALSSTPRRWIAERTRAWISKHRRAVVTMSTCPPGKAMVFAGHDRL